MIFDGSLVTWQVFELLYKTGSVQLTANALGVDKSFVSKRLSTLEELTAKSQKL